MGSVSDNVGLQSTELALESNLIPFRFHVGAISSVLFPDDLEGREGGSEGGGVQPGRVESPLMSSSTTGLVCCVVLWFEQVRKSLTTPNSREIL